MPEPEWVIQSSHIGTPSLWLTPAFSHECRSVHDSTVRKPLAVPHLGAHRGQPLLGPESGRHLLGALVRGSTGPTARPASDAATALPPESKQVAPARQRSATSNADPREAVGWSVRVP